jgi:hypothetical protein
MDKIRLRIAEKLREKLGAEFGMNIMSALNDKAIESQIKNLLAADKIQVVDQNDNVVMV